MDEPTMAPNTPAPTNKVIVASLSPRPTPIMLSTPTPSPATMNSTIQCNSAVPQVPFAELSKHDDGQDCWVALHQNVFELTSFLRLHPGGNSTLAPCCGSDCTARFDDQHNINMLEVYAKYYLVGPLERVVSFQELHSANTTDNCLVSYFGRVFNGTAYANSQDTLASYSQSKALLSDDITDLPCGTEINLEQFAALSPGISDFYVGALKEGKQSFISFICPILFQITLMQSHIFLKPGQRLTETTMTIPQVVLNQQSLLVQRHSQLYLKSNLQLIPQQQHPQTQQILVVPLLQMFWHSTPLQLTAGLCTTEMYTRWKATVIQDHSLSFGTGVAKMELMLLQARAIPRATRV